MPLKNLDEETITALSNLKKLKNVNFIGYLKREQVLDFFAKAIGLLATSYYEGFSNTFLEAFVSGTPVVAPLRIDPDHIISRNKLGLTSDSDEDLHKLIIQLNEMEVARYEVLVKRCRSYVLTHHAPEAKAKELIEILKLHTVPNK